MLVNVPQIRYRVIQLEIYICPVHKYTINYNNTSIVWTRIEQTADYLDQAQIIIPKVTLHA